MAIFQTHQLIVPASLSYTRKWCGPDSNLAHRRTWGSRLGRRREGCLVLLSPASRP